MVDDIERLVTDYRIDAVAIHDSNFFISKNRVRQFCEEMIKREPEIKWGNVNGRTKQLADYEDKLWELMEKSGCSMILVGSESGFQQALDFINKDFSVEDTIRFAKKCEKYNIKVIFSMLSGLPWDRDYKKTQELNDTEMELTLRLSEELISISKRNRILISNYTPYPGSPLYSRTLEMGLESPEGLEAWSEWQLDLQTTPWLTAKQARLVPQLTRYIFFMIDPDSCGWLSARISNRFLRAIFVLAFKLFTSFANFRWKHKFFAIPIDYWLYGIARERAKLV